MYTTILGEHVVTFNVLGLWTHHHCDGGELVLHWVPGQHRLETSHCGTVFLAQFLHIGIAIVTPVVVLVGRFPVVL